MAAAHVNSDSSRLVHETRRVLVVDDHPLMRQALREVIEADGSMTICGEAETVEQAKELAGQFSPHLAIIDISLGADDGLDLIRVLKAADPDLRMLVVSMHDEASYAERAIRAGAHGYVCKQSAATTVREAIRRVLSGRIYLSPDAVDHFLVSASSGGKPANGQERSLVSTLSDRELQILGMIGRGASTHEIAERLHLSVKTVGAHRHRIKGKLKVKHATELVRFAVQWSLKNA